MALRGLAHLPVSDDEEDEELEDGEEVGEEEDGRSSRKKAK